MTTLPQSPQHYHRSQPPPPSSAQSGPPSSLAIATAVVRRLVREQSSYVVELAGQEARLAELLLRRRNGEGGKEAGSEVEDGEDENWGYRVKQEVFLCPCSWKRGLEGLKWKFTSGVGWADCMCMCLGEGVGRNSSGIWTADGEDSDRDREIGGYAGTSISLSIHGFCGFSFCFREGGGRGRRCK